MKTLITFLLFSLIGNLATAQYSQYFMPPIDDDLISTARDVYVVTIAGDTVRGRVNSSTAINGQIRALTIKRADKAKFKYKAADIQVFAIRATQFMNMTSAMSAPNILRASEMDYDKTMKREWIIFDQALLPNKDKYALMQLLNPDFSSKIKVYVNPNANESGMLSIGNTAITGGEDTSYFVVTEGKKSEIYKKRKYDDEALTRLYKDCEAFANEYAGEKFKWKDFSEHVLVYDQLCE
jgi:hypothetical protein